MILLVDNYDSFSYNLYQLIGTCSPDIRVVRNDEKTMEEIREMKPAAIVLSPGPGRPKGAGRCVEIVQTLGADIPILGVCLGHQVICEAFGATISYAKALMHGKQSLVRVDLGCPIFSGLPGEIPVARYHSLAVPEETMPAELLVTAKSRDGEIMAVRHKCYPVYGLQFHPESILTPQGPDILRNFMEGIRRNDKRSDC